jgi:large subunit ribosomal protein L10
MNRLEKKDCAKRLRLKLDESSLVVVTRPSGLTVSEITDLRFRMKEGGADFKVIKNTLASIAVKDCPYEELSRFFIGPTALAYSKDPIAAAKVTVKYAESNSKISVVAGFLDGKFLSEAQVRALAILPSLDELRSKLIALVLTPATKLAILMKEPASRVARVLNEKSKQQQGEEEA